MSLLSNFIRNHLLQAIEQELIDATPQIKEIALRELKEFGGQIIEWAESKMNIDLNGDGKIGDGDEEES